MRGQVDAEERPLVLAASGVGRRHPASHQHAHDSPRDDLHANGNFVHLLALHPPDDRQEPVVAFFDRDELAQARGCILDRRDQPAARVAAVDDSPRCAPNPARDRFRIRARHHLRHFVEAGRYAGRSRRIRQSLDFGNGAGQRLQPDDDTDLAVA